MRLLVILLAICVASDSAAPPVTAHQQPSGDLHVRASFLKLSESRRS